MFDGLDVFFGSIIFVVSAFLIFILFLLGFVLAREVFFPEPKEKEKQQVIYIYPETMNDGCY